MSEGQLLITDREAENRMVSRLSSSEESIISGNRAVNIYKAGVFLWLSVLNRRGIGVKF